MQRIRRVGVHASGACSRLPRPKVGLGIRRGARGCRAERRSLMLAEKKALSLEDIDSQIALELPERETLALVTITCVVGCFGSINITVKNIQVATQVCASVQAISLLTGAKLSCRFHA